MNKINTVRYHPNMTCVESRFTASRRTATNSHRSKNEPIFLMKMMSDWTVACLLCLCLLALLYIFTYFFVKAITIGSHRHALIDDNLGTSRRITKRLENCNSLGHRSAQCVDTQAKPYPWYTEMTVYLVRHVYNIYFILMKKEEKEISGV